jgi:hypothetical protein
MNGEPQSLSPNVGETANSPKRILWKWSLAIAAIVLLFLIWQVGSAVYSGPKLSDRSVQHFHDELNRGRYEEICREGDEGFHQGDRHDNLLHFLQLVHTKLGDFEGSKQINLDVKAGTGGTFLTSQYSSHFGQGPAMETFAWRKHGSILTLYGYSVQ